MKLKSIKLNIIVFMLLSAVSVVICALIVFYTLSNYSVKMQYLSSQDLKISQIIDSTKSSVMIGDMLLKNQISLLDKNGADEVKKNKAKFSKIADEFNMHMNAIMWGTNSKLFLTAKDGKYAKLWQEKSSFKSVDKVGDKLQQISGFVKIYFSTFLKYSQEVNNKVSQYIALSQQSKSNNSLEKLEQEILSSYKNAEKYMLLTTKSLEGLNIHSKNYSDVLQSNIKSEKIKMLAILLGLGSIFTVAWILYGWLYLDSIVVKPLQNFSREIKKIKLTSFNEIKIDRNDEIGKLIKSFNDLYYDLTKSNISLEYSESIFSKLPLTGVIVKNGYVENTNDKFKNYFEIDGCGRLFKDILQEMRVCKNDIRKILTLEDGKIIEVEVDNSRSCSSTFTIGVSTTSEDNNRIYIFEDITKQKYHEKNLLEAKIAAENASLAKTEFLGNMSHELRTPLNAIIGFSDILSHDKKLPENAQSQIKNIYSSGRHLLSLVTNILDLTAVEAGSLDFELKPLKINNFIHDTVNGLTSLAKKNQVTIIKEIQDDISMIIDSDSKRLIQLIQHLVTNAIIYNKIDGTVTISCKQYNNIIKMQVKDTGIGISEENKELIFKPFTRLAKNIDGIGVGLSIVKILVEKMNGKIEVTSYPNEGSTFTLEFPVSKKSVSSEIIVDSNKLNVNPGKALYNILYVEDNEVNIELAKAVLSSNDALNLIISKTGHDGLMMLDKHEIDLVLLDINLPDTNGIDLCKQIRTMAKYSNIPIIGISAAAMPEQIQNAFDAGFDDYLTKPFNIDRLSEIVETKLNT